MKTKKIVSLLLAVLMACSVFAGLTVSAEDATHTYTVAGSDGLCGTNWDVDNTNNDMTLQADGTYAKVYANPAPGSYELKVVEDHSWNVNFTFEGSPDPNKNVSFDVAEGVAEVKVVLHITGATEEGKTTGYVEVLIDGTAIEGPTDPVIPDDQKFHVVAGDPGLCNGVTWDPSSEANKMTKIDDDTFEIVYEGIAAGVYTFKVTTNGKWDVADYNLVGDAKFGGPNAEIEVTEAQAPAKVKVSFKESEGFARAYINDVEVEVERDNTPSSSVEQTTNDKGETNSITSHGGYYSPAAGVETKRYYFYMPEDFVDNEGTVHNWYTFNNAMACTYWWEGTDNCNSLPIPDEFKDVEGFGGWQMSYRMKSAGIKNVYYIDVPTDVTTIIFSNGIDGGQAPDEEAGIVASPNWGKNYQTVNVACEYYDAGESAIYPEGTKSFNNMIYIPDVNQVSINEIGGSKQYGGEWYVLHADGTWDTTLVNGEVADPWVVPNIDVRLNKNAAELNAGETTTLVPEVTKAGAAVEWSTNNAAVATVDENGVVTALKKGVATITCKAINPADANDTAEANCMVTVKQPVKAITIKGTATVKTGKTVTLKATVTPADADNTAVTWSTSNKNIATVSAKGVVTGVKPGKVTITAKAKDGSGVKKTYSVTVSAQKSTKLTGVKKAYKVKVKKSVTIKPAVYPKNTYNKNIKITVDAKGKKLVKVTPGKTVKSGKKVTVKALKKGTAKVTFKAADNAKAKIVAKITVK
ncbi:MAG: Ig-like domain-containing protein [Oscillospiraceae bacterium]|nr:Ig-like domain-containing protein [Oscillospiraceae bacterium]